MLRIPDLVRDSRLDTQFHPEYTKHVYYETGLTPRQRKTRRDEMLEVGKTHWAGFLWKRVVREMCGRTTRDRVPGCEEDS